MKQAKKMEKKEFFHPNLVLQWVSNSFNIKIKFVGNAENLNYDSNGANPNVYEKRFLPFVRLFLMTKLF